jgi:hypothetical protein
MRNLRHRRAVALAGLAVTAVLVSSCSSGSTGAKAAPKPADASSGSTTTTAANGVNPNTPETAVAGDIPDTQVYVPFAGAGYTIKVPQGWARADLSTGAVFSDHFNTERLESSTAPAAPTVSSVRSATIPQLQGANAGFVLKTVTTVARPAGTVVSTTYQANSAPDPVTNKSVALDVERYDFWRNGTTVTVTLSAAKGSDNVDPWKTITNSFTWQ